jgi:hypothetical protein
VRGEFQRRLEQRLQAELENVYATIPTTTADLLKEERGRMDRLLAETREVADWLAKREKAADIGGMYGSQAQTTA